MPERLNISGRLGVSECSLGFHSYEATPSGFKVVSGRGLVALERCLACNYVNERPLTQQEQIFARKVCSVEPGYR